MTNLSNTQLIIAERDMLFAMLCRLAKKMHLLEVPSTGSFSGDYVLWAQVEPKDYHKLQDLQYRQGLGGGWNQGPAVRDSGGGRVSRPSSKKAKRRPHPKTKWPGGLPRTGGVWGGFRTRS